MGQYEKVMLSKEEIGELKTLPGLDPKIDDHFVDLIQRALKGRVPVYFAAVPLALIVPFDIDYRPDLHPLGKQLIDEYTENWKKNEYSNIMVYPKGKWFICPDDYLVLFGAIKTSPSHIGCAIFGEYDNDDVELIKGPLPVTDVQKMFGVKE